MNFKAIHIAHALAVLTAIAAAPAAMAADANGGTITINGAVSANSCTITPGGGASGTSDMTVKLPNVSSSELAANGATAGRTPFSIILSGCSGSSTYVTTFFANGSMVDQATGQLVIASGTGAASGIEISLLNNTQAPITVGAPVGTQNSQKVGLNSSGNTELKYFAQYIGTGKPVSPGSVSTQVQYSLTYE